MGRRPSKRAALSRHKHLCGPYAVKKHPRETWCVERNLTPMPRMPPPIGLGARIAIVAPASPLPRDELFRGLAWLRTRYELVLTQRILLRRGYLAGDDAARIAEMSQAMMDPSVGAIFCGRGGYGALRITDALPWEAFAKRPKWIVGFSDITTLHIDAARHDTCSLHAMNVTGMGRAVTAMERLSLIDALEGRPTAPWESLDVIHEGNEARGPLCGGNLALVEAMAAAGRSVVPAGGILLLEDVTERPYRIDRMLTALRSSGALGRASAIVFGDFTQCEPGPDGVTTREVITERTAGLGIPVVAGAPFGHGARNRGWVHGREATLAGATLHL